MSGGDSDGLKEITLGGSTVKLIPLSLEHLPDLLAYSVDASLWTWWLRKPPVDEATLREEIALALQKKTDGERLPFAIFHRELGRCIGSTSFWKLPERDSVEIGSTWVGAPFHRSGINRECKTLLLRHAFEELGMNRVVLQTDALNQRSRGAIEKLGAKLEGIRRDDKIAWNGRVRSSAVYSISKSEWRSRL